MLLSRKEGGTVDLTCLSNVAFKRYFWFDVLNPRAMFTAGVQVVQYFLLALHNCLKAWCLEIEGWNIISLTYGARCLDFYCLNKCDFSSVLLTYLGPLPRSEVPPLPVKTVYSKEPYVRKHL